ncbi:MAG: RnfH family protein [Rubrivivax sp.]|nr:RnfH family protein [Rubrivivax sp.]
MAPAEGARGLRVEVVYCPRPGVTDRVALTLPAGTTAAGALRASGMAQRHGLSEASLQLGIWCRVCEPGTPLRDRDRVEIYRPLVVDPKEARRQRYSRHKERLARA